jgi:hypothetical protein
MMKENLFSVSWFLPFRKESLVGKGSVELRKHLNCLRWYAIETLLIPGKMLRAISEYCQRTSYLQLPTLTSKSC